MNKQNTLVGLVTLGGVAVCLCGCQNQFAAMFVPDLFAITVLPPEDGGTHSVEQGETIDIDVQVLMGVNVSGSSIDVLLVEDNLPEGVSLALGEVSFQSVNNLGPNESAVATYALMADDDAAPGSYTVTVEATAKIEVEPGDEIDDEQIATFTLIVVDPDADPSDGGDGQHNAACVQYVEHYNSLPCAQNPLMVDNTCSASISENCTGESEFNECRIESTFCEGDTLINAVDDCFNLLDCSQ